MSIRLKLVLWFSACLVLAFLCLGIIVFATNQSVARKNFSDMAVAQLQRVEERINTFLAPGIMATEYLAETGLIKTSGGRLTSYVDTTERSTLLYVNHPPYEKSIYDEFLLIKRYNTNFDLVFMANNDGQYAQAPEGRYKEAGYDPRQRSWYRELMASPRTTVISSPYLTTGADIVCSIMTKTTTIAGKPLGMVGVDYKLTSLTSDLSDRRILETGYLVIFDPHGTIIVDGHHADYAGLAPDDIPDSANPGRKDNQNSARAFRKLMAEGEDGEFFGVGDRGLQEYSVTYTMPDTGWKLAVIFERGELMESSYGMLARMLMGALPLFLAFFLLTFLVAFRISQPLTSMAKQCTSIALGDISTDVPENLRKRRDEIGLLANSFQAMIQSSREELHIANALAQGDYSQSLPLRSDVDALGKALAAMVSMNFATLTQISSLVKSVNQGATLVSQASSSLSNGAQTSAAALEQVSATINQIGLQARDNARNASEASKFAGVGRDAAQRGYHAMNDLTEGMSAIREWGRKISGIVKLIDDIAFQTNLLSLNAAVEAARAGRNGKGFSVVAGEVRNLAARSAKAAHETSEMIKAMGEQLNAGAELAERSDREFREIVVTVDKAVHLFGNIADASASQSAALTQIVQSLGHVETVTQENSRHAWELAESADSLSGQADKLRKIVSYFRVSGNGEKDAEALGSGGARPTVFSED